MKWLRTDASRERLQESKSGPVTGDVDEDAMVPTLWVTRELMIAQLAAESARVGENHPVCEDHDGWDSPRHVDIFFDDMCGGALGFAGVTAARRTELEFIDGARVWQVRTSMELGDGVRKSASLLCHTWSRWFAFTSLAQFALALFSIIVAFKIERYVSTPTKNEVTSSGFWPMCTASQVCERAQLDEQSTFGGVDGKSTLFRGASWLRTNFIEPSVEMYAKLH